MENEKGFTMVEVLASLVIISIVLMSFMAMFTNSNRLAVSNSEKLVVVNLADSYLERVKLTPGQFIDIYPPTKDSNSVQKAPFIHTMNEKDYEVLVKIQNEPALPLLNVIVTIKSKSSNISSSVEGFVPYVKPSS